MRQPPLYSAILPSVRELMRENTLNLAKSRVYRRLFPGVSVLLSLLCICYSPRDMGFSLFVCFAHTCWSFTPEPAGGCLDPAVSPAPEVAVMRPEEAYLALQVGKDSRSR